jgi:hypothetical protein
MDTNLEVRTAVQTAIEATHKELADLGRSYPRAFVQDLSEKALDRLETWLSAHDAPQAVIDLTEHLVLLERISSRTAPLSDLEAEQLVEIVPPALSEIEAISLGNIE